MNNKLIVISLDALIYEDLDYLIKKPTFRMLVENGARVNRMHSIYPSLTYPCHTTMVTGCYPKKHGIVNNTQAALEKDPLWFFEHANVKCGDILDSCKKACLKTASVGWPVTGHHKSVDYLVNECWPSSDAPIEEYKEAYLANGTPQWLFDEVVAPVLWMRVGRKQPDSSFFLTKISAEIISKYQPDILMLHVGNVDSYRHKTGVFSDMVTRGLDECENMVAMLVQATKDAGVFEHTNFVVTADHGQLNTTRVANLNSLFASLGLIDVDCNGEIKDYQAWCKGSGMSGQIYLKDPDDKALNEAVYTLLKEKQAEGTWGISKVYTKEELKEMHLDGAFSFMVETDGCTTFGDAWLEPVVEPFPCAPEAEHRGNHGFHPDKGPRPPFVGFGPDFAPGVVLQNAELVDGAPTYAKLLGVDLPGADGRALEELLRKE